MSPVCTLMLGRLDDWVKADSSSKGMVLNADAANWGGVAVCKEAYRLYKERHYTTRILISGSQKFLSLVRVYRRRYLSDD